MRWSFLFARFSAGVSENGLASGSLVDTWCSSCRHQRAPSVRGQQRQGNGPIAPVELGRIFFYFWRLSGHADGERRKPDRDGPK